MKDRRNSEISESEESEEGAQPSVSQNVTTNFSENPVSEASSDSEDSRRPPSPPKRGPTPSPKKNVSSNPFEKFLAANRDLSKVAVNDVVSEDDEVCMLEVPTTIDPAHFIGKLINFNTKTKIKLDGSRYIVEPEVENVKPINLLARRLRVIRPISVLKLRQYKKKKRESGVVSSEVSPPPVLPDNLKVRHPLFGAEYKRKIALSEEVQRKLEEAVDVTVRKMKKKKKKHKGADDSHSFATPVVPNDTGKKKKDVGDEETEHQGRKSDVDESIFALLETHIAGREKHRNHVKEDVMPSFIEESTEPLVNSDFKKKKRKNSAREEMAVSESSIQPESRKRQNSVKREIIEARNSMSRFEENDFEPEKMRKHKKNNSKEEILTEAESSFANASFDESRSKKKKKRDSSLTQGRVSIPSMLDEPDSAPADESIKGKRKNTAKEEMFAKETALSEPSIQSQNRKRQNSVKRDIVDARKSMSRFEESDFEPEKMRKHKKNNSKEEILTEAESSFANASFDESRSKKKKKRDSSLTQGRVSIPSMLDEPDSAPADESIKEKRKNTAKEEMFTEEMALSEPSVQSQNRKRQNSVKRDIVEARNSMSQFEESDFETEKTRKHKKNNNKEEIPTKAESSFGYTNFAEKTPKKKRVSIIKEERVNTPSILDERDSTPADGSIKRKRKTSIRHEIGKQNRLIANSTILPGLQLPCFEFDVSDIVNNEVQNDSSRNEDDNSESLTQERHHKKKKKEKVLEDTRENDEETVPRLDLKQEHHKKKTKKEKSPEIGGGMSFEWMGLKQEKYKKSKKETSFGYDEKMRKRKIKEEYITAGESCSETETNKRKKRKRDVEEDEQAPPSKKKHRIKEERRDADSATSSLISHLLNKVKTEMDTPTSHRKRKSEK